ncbi:unnamed protein product [Alternaria alternata]
MAPTMKEAIYSDDGVVIKDSPRPVPGPGQVLIKVVVSGSNPKDWKYFQFSGTPLNSGDDIAGIVEEVGANVWEFKPGDRVAAFHEMNTPGGSYAEYAVAWQYTTFHIPETTSFEEAATIPLASMTAALGVFSRLGLPQPFGTISGEGVSERSPIPLLVNGGATAVGAYAIKLAQRANIHPIIAVAGRGGDFVEGLIDRSKGDAIVDYREGEVKLVESIKKALGGKKLKHAFDAVSENGSHMTIAKVLEDDGHVTFVLPYNKYEGMAETVKQTFSNVSTSHGDEKDFAYVYFRYMARGLAEGWFKSHPAEVIPGGLEGVQEGLERLRKGKASAVKYVFRIEETPGIKKA